MGRKRGGKEGMAKPTGDRGEGEREKRYNIFTRVNGYGHGAHCTYFLFS